MKAPTSAATVPFIRDSVPVLGDGWNRTPDPVPDTEPVPETERATHPPKFAPAVVVRRLRSEAGITGETSPGEVAARLRAEADRAAEFSTEEMLEEVSSAWLRAKRAIEVLRAVRTPGTLKRQEIKDLVSEVNNALAPILINVDELGAK